MIFYIAKRCLSIVGVIKRRKNKIMYMRYLKNDNRLAS